MKSVSTLLGVIAGWVVLSPLVAFVACGGQSVNHSAGADAAVPSSGGTAAGGGSGCPDSRASCGGAIQQTAGGASASSGGRAGAAAVGGSSSGGVGGTTTTGGSPGRAGSGGMNGCTYVVHPTAKVVGCAARASCLSLRGVMVAGSADASVPSTDGGASPSAIDVRLCESPSPDETYLLAFDAYSPGRFASFEVGTGSLTCEASMIEYFEIGDDPTDVATGWRSYCVPIPGSRLNDRLDVSAPGNPAIQIANPRFVPSCDCKRDVQWDTTCGLHGNGASSGCL